MAHNVQQVREFDHPGEGRRRAKATPKGRQVDPTAAHEIEQLLGDLPRRRDLLIEHLHKLNDRFGHLPAKHLAALAVRCQRREPDFLRFQTGVSLDFPGVMS